MTDPIEKRKKKEKLLIAERKVEKAWVRTSKINQKLKKAKRKTQDWESYVKQIENLPTAGEPKLGETPAIP